MSPIVKEENLSGQVKLTRQTRRCAKCGSTTMRAIRLPESPFPGETELDSVVFECPQCGHKKEFDRKYAKKRRKVIYTIGLIVSVLILVGFLFSGDMEGIILGGASVCIFIGWIGYEYLTERRYPITGQLSDDEGVEIDISQNDFATSQSLRRCRMCKQPTMKPIVSQRAGVGRNDTYRCDNCGHEHIFATVGGASFACVFFLLIEIVMFIFSDSPNYTAYAIWAAVFIGLFVKFNADDWFLYPFVGEDGEKP